MSTTTEQQTKPRALELAEFVRHAQKVRADFTLSVKTADELRMVLAAIGGFNDYNPAHAAAALGPMVGAMTEVRVADFVGGPRLYFRLPFWTHQRLDADRLVGSGTKYTVEERQATAQQLRNIGRQLKADEIGVRQHGFNAETVWRGVGADPIEVSLWWD